MMYCERIPERIKRLDELANNMWWSWHPQARGVFRSLDYQLWRLSGHNPVKQLAEASPEMLRMAAGDPSFVRLYDSVMSTFDRDMQAAETRFATSYPRLSNGLIGYFSMEYAIHNSLPIYAGGLGVLAGDICKEASDLGLPQVAVGFMYPQGYFHQHLSASADSCQLELYEQLDFEKSPINRVLSAAGDVSLAEVRLGGVSLAIGVWRVRVGRTDIYLLDTNLEQNPPACRQLSARLYVADSEQRLQQEMVLGIGGVRVLRALSINPTIWHANEGHTAFMMLERVREEVARGIALPEAMSRVRATTVFTTHTPLPAGHDVFWVPMVERYFGNYWESLGMDREAFMDLGRQDAPTKQFFNMTVLAMRMASQRCAVSEVHEKVTRKMWHVLWPDVAEDQVPISHITNGVHVPTWIAPEVHYLFQRYLGGDWMDRQDDVKLWERLLEIPDEELWAVHELLKNKLASTVRWRARNRWADADITSREMPAMGILLEPQALTIAFARRFAEYKRPALLFRDVERLKRILNNELYPVQIIFAGKSHPADLPGKSLVQHVYSLAMDHTLQGRIAFVENYDMHLARYLVQGVDVWLNTPRRLYEASGTSGMKAAINGALHLSVRDGWWREGYNGRNGWAIGGESPADNPEDEDRADAESLYRLLEDEIVPLYYSRDRNGVPHGWMSMVKESIRSIVPVFSARRMLKDYIEQMYLAAVWPPE